MCVFLNQCYDQIIFKFGFVLSQKRNFFAKFFGENILKIITSVPGSEPASSAFEADALTTRRQRQGKK
jgi:hypothetical protein